MPNAIHITAFGVFLLVAGSLALFFRRDWLLLLLPVAAVLQAPAAFVIGVGETWVGITPFNLAVAFCGLALLAALRQHSPRQVLAGLWQEDRRLWTVFLLLAAVAAWIFPVVFAGLPVHPLYAKTDVAPDPLPNLLSISHVAQSINSVGLLVVLAWAATLEDKRAPARLLWHGMLLALGLSVLVSLYHRGALLGHYPLAVEFWGSNPSYNQYFTSKYGPAYGRASLPFTEPSYASVWFAAMACATLAMVTIRSGLRGSRIAYAVTALLALTALANTLGTSGIAAFLMAMPIVLLLAYSVRRGGAQRRSLAPVLLLALLISAAVALLYLDYRHFQLAALAPVRAAIDFTWLKISWAPSGPRAWSTMRALAIVIETWGLGAGPGSTRTSSYLISLLANMGVIGTAIFLLALLRQLRWLWAAVGRRDEIAAALFAATVTCVIGAFGGVPDQNWPILWLILIAGAFAAGPAATADLLRRRAQPAQDLRGDGGGIEQPLHH